MDAEQTPSAHSKDAFCGCVQIEVTPAMVSAGLSELFEHRYGESFETLIEEIFRAMAYESPLLRQSAFRGS